MRAKSCHDQIGPEIGPILAVAVNHPVVKRLSTNPEFVALRARINAAPSVAERLRIVDAQNGYYAPGFVLSEPARIRGVLALLVLEKALSGFTAEWQDGANSRLSGELAASVIHAALLGCADANLIPDVASAAPGAIAAALVGGLPVAVALGLAKRYALDGATIADAVKTEMSLNQALDLLRQVDPAAADVAAAGAQKAGGEHSTAYGEMLRSNFVKIVANFVNPFTNPVWGGYAKAAAVIAVGAIVVRASK